MAKRTFTPTLMLGERTIGTRRAAASTRARASGVKPVEPMTRATPASAQTAACAAEASKLVKSTTTSAPAWSARESSPWTGTPSGGSPAAAPASRPAAKPGRSVAPTSASPSACSARRMCPPMRPEGPVTTTRVMRSPLLGARHEAEADHGLADLGQVRVRDVRERQPQLGASPPEERHCCLDRTRVRLDEHGPDQVGQRHLPLERAGVVAAQRRRDEVLHGARGDVRHDRDDAVAPAGDVREHREVVARQPGEGVLPTLLYG